MRHRITAVSMLIASLWSAGSAVGQTLSTYGTPGLIEMPSAEVFEDGNVALTTSAFGPISRNTFAFQIFPRVYGTFRYSITRDFSPTSTLFDGDLFDRSVDFHILLSKETLRWPSLAVGLRDIGGTGVLSSEYFVATKNVSSRLKVSGGLGWGRLATRGTFDNPLGILDDRFDTRPSASGDGGQLDADVWFRGPSAFFAGFDYQISDRLSVQLEYSTDAFATEEARGTIDIGSPINIGLNYRFDSGSQIKAFTIGGDEFGLQYSYTFDPAKRRSPGGLDRAPLPINLIDPVRDGRDSGDPNFQANVTDRLQELLEQEGIALENLIIDSPRATIQIENRRWDIEAQAIGRAARAMSQVFPEDIDTFVIIVKTRNLPNASVTIARSDLSDLETDYDGAWLSLTRARIADAPETSRAGELDGLYPKFNFGLGPYLALSLFDPSEPVRFDFGPELSVAYAPNPNLSLNGVFRHPIDGNIEDSEIQSDSVLPKVRTDAVLYAQQSDFEINRLTADYHFRPGKDLFGRVSVGYLENFFGGVSGELLWYPIDSRLAMGLEVNYVRQRDFEMLFGFQDYDVITGHASAYYDFGRGYLGQIDVGRYLAGDWGATFTLDREFNNGFRIGGYFTLTDVPFDDFGEGSFDRGIRISIPLSWLTGQPSRSRVSRTIQPILRDGGARLGVANRLFETTREYRTQQLAQGWGRFYR